MLITEIMSKYSIETKVLKNELSELKQILENVLKKIQELDITIKSYKTNKRNLSASLKELYKSQLQENKQLYTSRIIEFLIRQNESLKWIITAFYKIGQDITDDIYPQYLDEYSRNYLIEAGNLDYQIWKEIEKIKILNQKMKSNQKGIASNNKIEQTILGQNKFESKMNQVKQILFLNGQTHVQLIQLAKTTKLLDLANQNSQQQAYYFNVQEQQLQLLSKSKIDKKQKLISTIAEKINALEQFEYERLFRIHKLIEINERNLQNFIQKLITLFGKTKSKTLLLKYLAFRQYPLKKAKQTIQECVQDTEFTKFLQGKASIQERFYHYHSLDRKQ